MVDAAALATPIQTPSPYTRPMLKFLRKYQAILLVVGMSFLMVAFLVGPAIQQFTPNPADRRVASIGPAGEKVSAGDVQHASTEIEILEAFGVGIPSAFLNLDPENRAEHWLLLTYEAEKAGLIGHQLDGAVWLRDLAPVLAFQIARQRLLQQTGGNQQIVNMILSQPQQQQMILEQADQVADALVRNREIVAERARAPVEVIDQILAKARGVVRLRNAFQSAPRLSDREAVAIAADLERSAVTDYLFIPASTVLDQVPEPTDAQLADHVAEHEDTRPGDREANPFGFGYLQPPRIHLEWLALDPAAIAGAVEVDRIEVRKRWQRDNPDADRDAFEQARADIENAIRQETVDELLIEADQIVRAEILSKLRQLTKQGDLYQLPGDWTAPDLNAIAQAVVDQLAERRGVTIPAPRVFSRSERWLTARELAVIPGLGRAEFRVGSNRLTVANLPAIVVGEAGTDLLPVQVDVPVIDPPATGADGSRYYVTVLRAREQSPPDSFEEVRQVAAGNWKQLQAYERLTESLEEFRRQAQSEGLQALADRFAPPPADDGARTGSPVSVSERARVANAAVSPPDPRVNLPAFREPLAEIAAGLDPFADPGSIDPARHTVAVVLPESMGVAVAQARAQMPLTIETYRRGADAFAVNSVRGAIAETEGFTSNNPFSVEALERRLGFKAESGERFDDEDESEEEAG